MVGETQVAREGCLSPACGERSVACPVSGQAPGEGQREASPDRGKQLVEVRGMRVAWTMGPGISISVFRNTRGEGEEVNEPLEG